MHSAAYCHSHKNTGRSVLQTVHRLPSRVIPLPLPGLQEQPGPLATPLVTASSLGPGRARRALLAIVAIATVLVVSWDGAIHVVTLPPSVTKPQPLSSQRPTLQPPLKSGSAPASTALHPAPTAGAKGRASKAGDAASRAEPTILALDPRGKPSIGRDEAIAVLFGSHNWNPPPPAPVAVVKAPPPKPTAPPLPFIYLGKMSDSGVWEAYLARGEETFVAREHALIDANYRIETIVPPIMTITYLPLKQTQTLAIGDQ